MTIEEAMERVRTMANSDDPRSVHVWPGTEALRLILDDHERLRDTVDGLSSEVNDLQGVLNAKITRVDVDAARERAYAAEARVKALEDALRPFAMFSRGYGRHARDDSWVLVVSGTGERKITMGDVRLAEDVLAALEAKP